VLVLTGTGRGATPKHKSLGPWSLTTAQMQFWIRDAECETGHTPPYWDYGKPGSGHGGPRYEGGIGFYPPTWTWWSREAGVSKWRHAYDAPPWAQALAAQWGLDHIGTWGCAAILLRHGR
jgi:hypothetical protein